MRLSLPAASSMSRRVPGSMPARIVQVQHRIAAGAEAHALVIGGQKAAAPQAREERLVRVQRLRLREHHDERRQILGSRCRGRS